MERRKRQSVFSDDEEDVRKKVQEQLEVMQELDEFDEDVRQQYQEEIDKEQQDNKQQGGCDDSQDGIMDSEEEETKDNSQTIDETKRSSRISFRFDIPQQQASDKFEGYLLKKSPHILRGWQKRLIVIQNNKFMYFKEGENNMKKMMGYLDFNLIDIEFKVVNICLDVRKSVRTRSGGQCILISLGNRLKPKGNKKEFIFKSHDRVNKDLKDWKSKIEMVIEATKDIDKTGQNYVGDKKFWRVSWLNYVSLKGSAAKSSWRKGFNTAAKLQRSFTGSVYDHVALLVKYKSGDLILFEAVGRTGVGLCRWKTFLQKKWYKLYDKLVFRHLELERPEPLLDDLQKFVKQMHGKKYSVSPSKLLKKNEDNESYETFFCSELVAACYKKLGLLPSGLSASQYWPGSFSSEKDLGLLKGKLGEELLIDFSDQ